MKLLIVLFLTLFFVSCYRTEDADLIVHNANIITMDKEGHVYEAMAINKVEDDVLPNFLDFAQKNIRILSGLYGILKPIFKKNDGITLENLPFNFNQHYYVDSSHYNKKATEIIANGIFEYIY